MAEYKYPLTNEWKGARERLSEIEGVYDPWTIRNFGKLGVREGWHCLEIGGGGGSIAEWLCRKVGRSGQVVATDLQPHFLEAINASNLEVWRHDILSDSLPEGAFDPCTRARFGITGSGQGRADVDGASRVPSSSGSRGHLPRSRGRLASRQPRPCEPWPAQGDERDRGLPHGGPWRPCCAL